MSTLPALSVTDRYALKALELQQSQILHAGLVWYCRGRTVIGKGALRSLNAVSIPKNATALCVSSADFEAVRDWLG